MGYWYHALYFTYLGESFLGYEEGEVGEQDQLGSV